MKISGFTRRLAAVSLSFVLSFVFCFSNGVSVIAATAPNSNVVKKATPSSATKASASDAAKELFDEDGFLIDAELENDLPEEKEGELEVSVKSAVAKAEEAPEREEAHFEYAGTIGGYRIEISADEGVFPKGTTVEIEKTDIINQDAIDEILQNKDTTESVVSAVSFDIRFMYQGEELQPENGTVSVSIRLSDEMDEIRKNQEDSQVRVFHEVDAEAVEEIECACDENSTVSYEAESFSTYTLAVTAPTDSIELSGECGEGVTWEVKNNTLTIKGSGAVTSNPWLNYTDIKAKVSKAVVGEGITELPDRCFEGMTGMKTATLPEGITAIPSRCFSQSGIETINIPNSVTFIGYRSFEASKIKEVELPAGVTELGQIAFRYCEQLKTVRLNEGLREIGGQAFTRSGIEEIVIPSTVVSLGTTSGSDTVLYNCTFLRKVTNQSRVNIVLPDAGEAFWIEESTGVQVEKALAGKTVIWTTEDPADRIEFSGECGDNATWEVKNNTLTIKGSGAVTSNPWLNYTDIKTKVSKAVVEEGITELPDRCFEGMTGMKTATLPEGITAIPSRCFSQSGIETINIPNSVTFIGYRSFEASKIKEVELPAGVTELGQISFRYCEQLKTVRLNEGLREIGGQAFTRSGIEEIVIPSTVVSLGTTSGSDTVLYNCTFLRKVINQSGVNIVLPDAGEAFWIEESTGVQVEKALAGKTVIWTTEDPADRIEFFGECGDNATWEVKNNILTIKGSGAVTSNPWLNYTDIKTKVSKAVVVEGITELPDRCFEGMTGMKTATLPEGITAIPSRCFSQSGIETINIPNSVTFIGYRSFEASKIKEVELPAGVTELGQIAFRYCDRLKTVRLNEGLQKIGGQAFAQSGIEEIVIPSTVVSLGTTSGADTVLYHCFNLRKITNYSNLTIVLPDNEYIVWRSERTHEILLSRVPAGETALATFIRKNEATSDDSDADDYAATIGKTDSNGRYLPDTYPDASWVLAEDGNWYLQRADGQNAVGWAAKDGFWYYMDPQTKKMATGWVYVYGLWYHLGATGAMETGWIQIDGKWYYLFKNGSLAVNTLTPDGYYVDEKGEWIRPE